MMKKICLMLIVFIVFLAYTLPTSALNEKTDIANNSENSLSVNLINSNDFYVELEKKGIDAEDSEEYNISGTAIAVNLKQKDTTLTKKMLVSNL